MAMRERTRKAGAGQLSMDSDQITEIGKVDNIEVQQKLRAKSKQLHKRSLDKDDLEWKDSAYDWIRTSPPGKRFKVGTTLLDAWAVEAGIPVAPRTEKTYTRKYAGMKVSLKFSTRWKDHVYVFQGITDSGYDILALMAIDPDDVKLWFVELSQIVSNVPPGANGQRWLSFKTDEVPEWLKNSGGNLDKAAEVFKKLKDKVDK